MTDTSYFNLHTTGLGYLNRLREVKLPRGGESFLAVDISAMHGGAGQVQYTRFDCKVCGSEAKQIVRQLKTYLDAEQRVLIKFNLSDLLPETFVYKQGEKIGQTGISLKARLLRIDWAQVDGEYVVRPKVRADAEEVAA